MSAPKRLHYEPPHLTTAKLTPARRAILVDGCEGLPVGQVVRIWNLSDRCYAAWEKPS